MKIIIKNILLLISTFILGSSVASAAGLSVVSGNEEKSPRNDGERILPPSGMVEKRLDNGLTYIIMPNDSPSRMIEFRIMFKAGSVMETDGNRGAAHFLEHMAFGGTKHFPDRRLIEYLESLGAQFGMGINAYTGHDRTVYMFYLPSDDPETLDKALLILKDWLSGIDITRSKVEGEKGIIMEELRGYDVGDEFYDLKIGTSGYSRGIPLGTEEDITGMTPKILKDFKKEWYTVDRTTVAVVGDVDAADMEERIIRMFGSLPDNPNPKDVDIPMEYAPGTAIKCLPDTLVQRMTLDLMIPHRATMKQTLGDAVRAYRNEMLIKGIGNRLYATERRAGTSNHWYLADKEHFVISVSGKDREAVARELGGAWAEISRIAKEGFCEGEMEILQKSVRVRPGYEGNSSYICSDFEETVLLGDRKLSDRGQTEYLRTRLEETASEDLQEILREWIAGESRLAACKFNPEATEGFTAGDIDRILSETSSADLEPYTFAHKEEAVYEKTPVPAFLLQERDFDKSLIAERTYYRNIGVTDVILKNGFRFVLRPTKDEEGQVQMQLFAPGGLSRVPEDEFALYEGMAGYMELGGIEGMSDDDYFSILPENRIGLLLAMESYWHGIIASAPSENIRLMFNLVREKMLRPRLNHEEFEEIRKDELENFGEESYLSKLMKVDVQRQLNMQIDSLMGALMYGRRTEITKADYERMDLDDMASMYRSLYSNPTGMTCVICGAFDVDELLREAVPVFGSIEAGAEPNKMGASHFVLPEKTVKYEYPNANETQTIFDYIRFGQYEPSLRSGLKLKLLNGFIRNRLLVILREQESLVYSPISALFYTANPDRIFYIDINASVDRNNTERVHEVLDEIIIDLQKRKVSRRELDSIQKIFIVNKRNYLEENATSNWKTYLVGQMKNDETLVELDMYEDVLYSITPEELQEDFIRCFDTDRYMILSIGPFKEFIQKSL